MAELREKVKLLIEKYENEENLKELQKVYIINKMLEDDKLFFSIPIEDALRILKDLQVENYKEKYVELMSFSNLKKL